MTEGKKTFLAKNSKFYHQFLPLRCSLIEAMNCLRSIPQSTVGKSWFEVLSIIPPFCKSYILFNLIYFPLYCIIGRTQILVSSQLFMENEIYIPYQNYDRISKKNALAIRLRAANHGWPCTQVGA